MLETNHKMVCSLVNEVESDHILIVCQNIEASIMETIISQTGWGRVRGIVKESKLIEWYELCLILMKLLIESFEV